MCHTVTDRSSIFHEEHSMCLRTICDMGVGGPGLTPVELGGHGPGVLCPGPGLKFNCNILYDIHFVKSQVD